MKKSHDLRCDKHPSLETNGEVFARHVHQFPQIWSTNTVGNSAVNDALNHVIALQLTLNLIAKDFLVWTLCINFASFCNWC